MNPILEKIKRIGLVPVIKIDDAEKAVPLARALSDGGIPVAEVTFRTDCAAEAIANIARELPDVLVGAGTVVSVEQVKAAVDAGAKYIISPGFDSEVVKYCIENDIPITPGCSSASDVGKAVKLGLECVKFFPAETVGGLKALKALAGPFPKMKFIPTGGINPDNLGSYLAFNKIIACGGSWMVPQKLVDANDWQGITEIARQAVTAMLNLRIVHIGINSDDEATCRNTCALLSKILCAPLDALVHTATLELEPQAFPVQLNTLPHKALSLMLILSLMMMQASLNLFTSRANLAALASTLLMHKLKKPKRQKPFRFFVVFLRNIW